MISVTDADFGDRPIEAQREAALRQFDESENELRVMLHEAIKEGRKDKEQICNVMLNELRETRAACIKKIEDTY